MRRLLSIIVSLVTAISFAQQPVELPLWPDGAPNSSGLTGEEQETRPHFVTNVTHPTLTVYHPEKPNGMAIIMCPGGGYRGLGMDGEGYDMAPWFCGQGITYIVLKYRMPNGHWEVPVSDAEQAIRMVRQHAKEWNVNPYKVGLMGASAGGHVIFIHDFFQEIIDIQFGSRIDDSFYLVQKFTKLYSFGKSDII